MTNKRGFTLLEISMVLVIVALIIGAITVGSSLIRNAEIQSISSDSEHYISAIKSFQDKYSALPGDFAKASNVFVGATDGDANGFIAGNEQFYAWNHLALAKMIEGSYTGAAGSNGRVPGTNVPASQLSAAGWGLIYAAPDNPYLLYSTGDILPGHVLWFGGRSVSPYNTNEQELVLTAEEADQIDRKFDDAFPATGKIVAQANSAVPLCQSSTTAYNVLIAGHICALVFKTGY
jgi:prepilin-type N-terminal cleavage/methylation domain-containing protein